MNGAALAAVTAILAAWSGSHALAPASKPIHVLKAAPWDSAPSPADVAAARPKGGAAGQVVMNCAFRRDGELKNCFPVLEQPMGKGYFAAAQKLSAKFHAIPGSLEGMDLDATMVTLTIHFPAPDEALPTTLKSVEWIHTLLPEALVEIFPTKAAEAGLSTGRAVLDCVADAKGMMTGCQVVGEDPAGMGFGPSALGVASIMGVNPWTEDGMPAVGAHVKFALRLNDKELAPVAANAAAQPPKAQ